MRFSYWQEFWHADKELKERKDMPGVEMEWDQSVVTAEVIIAVLLAKGGYEVSRQKVEVWQRRVKEQTFF